MKYWRGFGTSIEEVEIDRASEHHVFINGCPVLKNRNGLVYAPTRDEVKKVLISIAKADLKKAIKAVNHLHKDRLSEIERL